MTIGEDVGGDLYTEPIAGFRLWKIGDDAHLEPVTQHHPDLPDGEHDWEWDTDRAARCRPLCWPTPPRDLWPIDECCRGGPVVSEGSPCCGLYGYWHYDSVRGHAHGLNTTNILRGVIIAWGRVQLAAKGFRAQYARPIAFLNWPERRVTPRITPAVCDDEGEEVNVLVEEMAELYRARLVGLAELKDIVAQYPKPV